MVKSRSFIATPPGATIKEQLIDRSMSQKEFAVRMDMSEKHISKLINGEVQLTPETALKLEVVLGVPAKFWNNLEAIYREKLLRADAENKMDEDLGLSKQFPYNEMAKYGWVPTTEEARARVINLRKYFEVVNLSLLESVQLHSIAYRQLTITKKSDMALMAWAQAIKIKAREVHTAPINIKRLIAGISEIRKMTILSPKEFCPKLEKKLADCGIALVFLPRLSGSDAQSASFMAGNKIALGLAECLKTADVFWFGLFHELAHIVLGHIDRLSGTSEEDEKSAEQWADNVLIPADDFEKFRQKGDYSEDSVILFAHEQGIAPKIVVQKMQVERLIKYSELSHLKK